MLPFYLLGNLHCLGMCGPLVLMIGQHRFRYWYFLGRTISFSLAGMLAGEIGSILHIFLQQYHIPALTSFLFGGTILLIGLFNLFGLHMPGSRAFGYIMAPLNKRLPLLLLMDKPAPTFMFGFFTLFLPCGQLIIVYSVCAMSGDPYVGLVNGFVFALLTSPSLFVAMHARNYLSKIRRHYNTVMGVLAFFIGTLAICRGLAEVGTIDHLVVNADSAYHFAIY